MSNKHPKGWRWTTLGEISDVIGGGTPSTKIPEYFERGEIPWLTPADLSGYSNKYISRGERCITESGLKNSSAKMLPAGTVLFTSRAPVGYVAIASNPICTNQGFKSFVLKDGVLADYVYWWLKGNKVLAESFASGTTFLELSGAKAKQLPIPFPPTIEDQKRIVAEIEKQFSRLDEAVTALKRIQANLKRYKAAVLKAAVEGKLTEQWRKEHPGVEPADQLLKRILAERRAKWEAEELAKMKAKGIKPKDDSWKKKYKEPDGPDTENLPELPEGWVWASAERLGDVRGGLTKNPKRASLPLQLPYLRVANVYANELRLDEIEYIGIEERERAKLLVLTGDLLIVEGNGSPEQIGRVAVWDGSIEPCVHQNHLIKVRLSSACLPKWTLYWLLSANGRNYIREVSSSTSGLYTLSVGKVGGLPVPLPSLTEQQQIADEIDRRLSVTEELETTIYTNLKRAERLRQTILQRAFAGEL